MAGLLGQGWGTSGLQWGLLNTTFNLVDREMQCLVLETAAEIQETRNFYTKTFVAYKTYAKNKKLKKKKKKKDQRHLLY